MIRFCFYANDSHLHVQLEVAAYNCWHHRVVCYKSLGVCGWLNSDMYIQTIVQPVLLSFVQQESDDLFSMGHDGTMSDRQLTHLQLLLYYINKCKRCEIMHHRMAFAICTIICI